MYLCGKVGNSVYMPEKRRKLLGVPTTFVSLNNVYNGSELLKFLGGLQKNLIQLEFRMHEGNEI